jgi:hypothetical protein
MKAVYIKLIILFFGLDGSSELDNVVEFVSLVGVLLVILKARIERYETVLSTNVKCVVNLPVDLTDFACRVEKTLEHVL